MPISDELRDTAAQLVRRYPVARSALLPLLHLVQSEQGHVTDEGISFCAETLGLTKAEVGAVSTFYTMFKREPVGDWLISICTNPTCKYAGAEDIYARFQERLGGHHDPESGVSVEHAECLGICDAAPVIQVNYEMYGPLPEGEVDALLDGCMRGEPPASNWSGVEPRTFREVEFELSGAADGWGDRLAHAARAQVAAEVPPSYRTGETDLPVTHPGGDPKGVGGELLRERLAGERPATAVGDEQGEAEATVAGRDEGEVPPGTGGGVAGERTDQTRGQGTGPSPATEDQPDLAPSGDVPAEETRDDQVEATDVGPTDTVEHTEDQEPAPPHELPEPARSDETVTTTPDMEPREDGADDEPLEEG